MISTSWFPSLLYISFVEQFYRLVNDMPCYTLGELLRCGYMASMSCSCNKKRIILAVRIPLLVFPCIMLVSTSPQRSLILDRETTIYCDRSRISLHEMQLHLLQCERRLINCSHCMLYEAWDSPELFERSAAQIFRVIDCCVGTSIPDSVQLLCIPIVFPDMEETYERRWNIIRFLSTPIREEMP